MTMQVFCLLVGSQCETMQLAFHTMDNGKVAIYLRIYMHLYLLSEISIDSSREWARCARQNTRN